MRFRYPLNPQVVRLFIIESLSIRPTQRLLVRRNFISSRKWQWTNQTVDAASHALLDDHGASEHDLSERPSKLTDRR